jgi:hypothetical protein
MNTRPLKTKSEQVTTKIRKDKACLVSTACLISTAALSQWHELFVHLFKRE